MPRWDRDNPFWEAVKSEVTTIGLDLAKNVFQVHDAAGTGHAVVRKKLRPAQVLKFFKRLPPCVVAMEARGVAHYWAREIGKLGHEVRLIPPAYVKPFVKRQSEVDKKTIQGIVFPPNDAADAEAICEAAVRPSRQRRAVSTMRFVPVKSEEIQATAMVFRVRELLIRQRTQPLNALRGHCTEFGVIAPNIRIQQILSLKISSHLQQSFGDCK